MNVKNLHYLNERYDWLVKQATDNGREIIRASLVGAFRRCRKLISLSCKYRLEGGDSVVDVIAEYATRNKSVTLNVSEKAVPYDLDPEGVAKALWHKFDTPAGIMVFRHTYGLYCTVHMTRKGEMTVQEDEHEYDRTG